MRALTFTNKSHVLTLHVGKIWNYNSLDVDLDNLILDVDLDS